MIPTVGFCALSHSSMRCPEQGVLTAAVPIMPSSRTFSGVLCLSSEPHWVPRVLVFLVPPSDASASVVRVTDCLWPGPVYGAGSHRLKELDLKGCDGIKGSGLCNLAGDLPPAHPNAQMPSAQKKHSPSLCHWCLWLFCGSESVSVCPCRPHLAHDPQPGDVPEA